MSRAYESNGPDVKIRGTAAHIAEKYASLARDAISMGDNVMAENYLQHAEHYNRIIAAAAAQQASRNEENAGYGRGPQPDIGGQDHDEDDGDEPVANNRPAPARQQNQQSAEPAENSEEPTQAASSEQRPRGESRSRRRPRRERDNSGGEAGEAAEGANGVHAANGNGSDKPKRDISSDASMLPESILGAAPSSTEVAAED